MSSIIKGLISISKREVVEVSTLTFFLHLVLALYSCSGELHIEVVRVDVRR